MLFETSEHNLDFNHCTEIFGKTDKKSAKTKSLNSKINKTNSY